MLSVLHSPLLKPVFSLNYTMLLNVFINSQANSSVTTFPFAGRGSVQRRKWPLPKIGSENEREP